MCVYYNREIVSIGIHSARIPKKKLENTDCRKQIFSSGNHCGLQKFKKMSRLVAKTRIEPKFTTRQRRNKKNDAWILVMCTY